MTKPTKCHVRPAQTPISLGIRPIGIEALLSAWRNIGPLTTYWAHSEDSDQTGRMPRLIWVFGGRPCHFVGFVMRRLNVSLRKLVKFGRFWQSGVHMCHTVFWSRRFFCESWRGTDTICGKKEGSFQQMVNIQISPRKKLLFFAFTPRTKIFKRELSRRKLAEKTRGETPRRVSLRNFAQILRENSRMHLRNVYRDTLMN